LAFAFVIVWFYDSFVRGWRETATPFPLSYMRASTRILFVGLICGFMAAYGASAQVSVWRSGNGDYRDARKWNPDGVPGVNTPIRIEGGEVSWTEQEPYELSRAAATEIDGGTLLLAGTFRNGVEEAAELRIASGGIFHAGNYFVLGFNAPGTVVQTGGFLEVNVATAFFFSDHRGAPVEFLLEDGDVKITYQPRVSYEDRWQAFMGKAQNDRWTINGGTVEINAENEDFVRSGDGGADFQANRGLSIRRSSRLELNGGEVRVRRAARLAVGEGTPGDALLTLNGGLLEILDTEGSAGGVAVGVGGEGILVVNDGNLLVTVAPNEEGRDVGLLVGSDDGYGSLEINGGVVDLAGLNLEIARGGSSVGQVRMTGGALRAKNIRPASSTSSARFQFEGGLIVLSGDRRDIVEESFFQANSQVQVSYDATKDETRLLLDL